MVHILSSVEKHKYHPLPPPLPWSRFASLPKAPSIHLVCLVSVEYSDQFVIEAHQIMQTYANQITQSFRHPVTYEGPWMTLRLYVQPRGYRGK